ncbi:unnamed protein product [Penicillium salamii]|uniref:Uncharacterized protein n=1 Tax=Penicillium salamii TaxID=1612424 RepID=A0A9W4I7Q5_9EURO|nr:unnamed protein product [Penicillium salamii]CAG8257008.1 unnamed protein product [Penicillium salamii]CAG8261166.1 unnamed protein product [Penicillium salamii]CAG8375915.1 unnamed protein product [Penicillium salamii]CAG8405935.1 unnamed protein product [Penicillium salamii]
MIPPNWVSLYRRKVSQLCELQSTLEDQKSHSTLKKQRNSCFATISNATIEIHSMDFATGATRCMLGHFSPDVENAMEICSDDFSKLRELMNKYQRTDRSSMQETLLRTFIRYSRNGKFCDPGPWTPSCQFTQDTGNLFNSSDKHGFTIESGATMADTVSGHRIVIMKSDSLVEKTLPSVGEILVLVRWMSSGYRPQMKHLRKAQRLSQSERFIHDFPTMVISFLPDCRVRILYGYFDQGRLKVAYTEAINFDANNYSSKMGVLVQWAWPLVNFDTRKPIPLLTISEETTCDTCGSAMRMNQPCEECESGWETEFESDLEGEEIDVSGCEETNIPRCEEERPSMAKRPLGTRAASKIPRSILGNAFYARLMRAVS